MEDQRHSRIDGVSGFFCHDLSYTDNEQTLCSYGVGGMVL